VDVEHLKAALTATNPETGKLMFEILVDMDGSRFCGLFMDWAYKNVKSTSPSQVITLRRHSNDSSIQHRRSHNRPKATLH
jgi:hypothetical protein